MIRVIDKSNIHQFPKKGWTKVENDGGSTASIPERNLVRRGRA